jgi:hypothetical protein
MATTRAAASEGLTSGWSLGAGQGIEELVHGWPGGRRELRVGILTIASRDVLAFVIQVIINHNSVALSTADQELHGIFYINPSGRQCANDTVFELD